MLAREVVIKSKAAWNTKIFEKVMFIKTKTTRKKKRDTQLNSSTLY